MLVIIFLMTTTTNKLTATAEATDEQGNKLYWNAYVHIAEFALPLIKSLDKAETAYPSQFERWEDWSVALKAMIFSLEYVSDDDPEVNYAPIFQDKVQHGLDLFGKHFRDLWD
jgi:hypothetical protein